MDKGKLKLALKELFESNEIEITTDISHGYDGNYIETIVYIDDEEVYKYKGDVYMR